jgi:hypothetical protein
MRSGLSEAHVEQPYRWVRVSNDSSILLTFIQTSRQKRPLSPGMSTHRERELQKFFVSLEYTLGGRQERGAHTVRTGLFFVLLDTIAPKLKTLT